MVFDVSQYAHVAQVLIELSLFQLLDVFENAFVCWISISIISEQVYWNTIHLWYWSFPLYCQAWLLALDVCSSSSIGRILWIFHYHVICKLNRVYSFLHFSCFTVLYKESSTMNRTDENRYLCLVPDQREL